MLITTKVYSVSHGSIFRALRKYISSCSLSSTLVLIKLILSDYTFEKSLFAQQYSLLG